MNAVNSDGDLHGKPCPPLADSAVFFGSFGTFDVNLVTGSDPGAPTLLEVHIWLRRRQDRLQASWLDDWLVRETTQVVPFDERLERAAALAYHRFGKGQHRANLNFGDCMAYAVAKQENLPLLFKGGDFGQTDAVIHPASIVLSG